MKKQIVFKYPLSRKQTELWLPADSYILCVQTQLNTPTIWALIEEGKMPMESRTICVFNTGEEFMQEDNELFAYIGTVQYTNGIVQHVFERLTRNDKPDELDEQVPF